MTNRRTSVYTIRVAPDQVARVAAGLREQSVPICDLGDAAVSFRSTGDAAAYETFRQAYWLDATLTTGLGVHRRTVEAGCLTT